MCRLHHYSHSPVFLLLAAVVFTAAHSVNGDDEFDTFDEHMELLQDAGNQAAEHKKNWHAFLDKHVNKKLHSSKMAKNKKTKVSFWYKKYLKRDMQKTKQNQGNKLKALANKKQVSAVATKAHAKKAHAKKLKSKLKKKQVAAVATKAKGHSFTKKTKSKKLSKSAFEKSQKAPLEK